MKTIVELGSKRWVEIETQQEAEEEDTLSGLGTFSSLYAAGLRRALDIKAPVPLYFALRNGWDENETTLVIVQLGDGEGTDRVNLYGRQQPLRRDIDELGRALGIDLIGKIYQGSPEGHL